MSMNISETQRLKREIHRLRLENSKLRYENNELAKKLSVYKVYQSIKDRVKISPNK